MNDVAILNYNMGNLRSIKAACDKVGLKSVITNDQEIVMNSKSLLLPGVGAYNQAMKNLKKLNLVNTIKKFNKSGKPIIGICLGMQLLFDESNEIKNTKGLGLIKGSVDILIKEKNQNNDNFHIGWNKIKLSNIKNTLLDKKLKDKKFYFIHKYVCYPADKRKIIAKSIFKDNLYCVAIKFKNIEAYQFHPEKSGINGLKIYSNLKRKLFNEKSL